MPAANDATSQNLFLPATGGDAPVERSVVEHSPRRRYFGFAARALAEGRRSLRGRAFPSCECGCPQRRVLPPDRAPP